MTSPLPASLKALYPFAPQSIKTGRGAQMSFLDEGPPSDEAVLMLHGNPTWSFYYRNVVLALREKIRCVVPDHIGMGLSEKPQDYPYTLEQRIQDVVHLVTSLGLKRVHLVVHDWGGAIGFGLATRHPELIGRIVVLNTAAFLSDRIPRRISLCRVPWMGALLVRGFNGFAWPATWMSVAGRKLTAAESAGFLFPYNSWANRVAVHQFVRDIPMEPDHPTRRTLAEIEAKLGLLSAHPKTFIWGAKDFCFNESFLTRFRDLYPDAPVHLFPNAGHYVLEDTDDEACDWAVRFLLEGKT